MTTKVVIACPDNSVHDALVYVEHKANDAWTRNAPPVSVAPRTTAAPIYLTSTTRVVIEEGERGHDDGEAKPKA